MDRGSGGVKLTAGDRRTMPACAIGGRATESRRKRHMLCNSILARVTDHASFETVENFGQIEPNVPGCNLT